ncbi:MAG TPA: hypothetical protein VJ256_04400 [Dehalococcoidia bacterium]|nr:hypothetical protein [Dehalococcoidia bacterium]
MDRAQALRSIGAELATGLTPALCSRRPAHHRSISRATTFPYSHHRPQPCCWPYP